MIDRPFVVVLSLSGTRLFPESLREQWEEIVVSVTAVEVGPASFCSLRASTGTTERPEP